MHQLYVGKQTVTSRTMFVSHEQNANKKKYQKPNILRKKPHISVLRPVRSDIESPTSESQYVKAASQHSLGKIKQDHGNSFQIETIIPKKKEVADFDMLPISSVSENNLTRSTKCNILDNNLINNNECLEQVSLNVESFLNSATTQEESKSSMKEQSTPNENWCLGFIDSKEIVVSTYNGSQICNERPNTDLMSGAVSSLHPEYSISEDVHSTDAPAQNVTIDCFSSRAVKFKCDEPNCSKGFWSELKLKKHKNAHNKQSRARGVQIVECPVKKNTEDGTEERCGRTFLLREQLSKHLNEDHSPDDALYRCEVCGRRFFWAVGLRAHRQAQCARGALACAWPGCGKLFRQPCRLREHARAHTGDRPYACPFPECGWAFRSASKLQRHARRHTGERRHVCSVCGRAFLRREHLREHCARCHPPHAAPPAGVAPAAPVLSAEGAEGAAPRTARGTRAPRALRAPRTPRTPRTPRAPRRARTLPSVSQISNILEENKHVIDPNTATVDSKCELADCGTVIESIPVRPRDNTFVLNLVSETKLENTCEKEQASCAEEAEEEEYAETADSGVEGRAARTHCPWPLHRPHAHTHAHAHAHSHAHAHAHAHALYQHDAYVLEEDVPTEQSESSENNIFTVRSDLFLHGNVLINEDSDGEGSATGATGAGGEIDEGLDYINVHPTIDLMSEELMYADAAVDESSFRVFLMNGEELT